MADDLGLGVEDFPGFPAEACPASLPDLSANYTTMAEVFKESPALWDALRGRSTELGVGLARCVKVGMDNPGHRMVRTLGLVAGDGSCFETFRELFDAAIRRHLGLAPAQPPAAPPAPAAFERLRPSGSTGRYLRSARATAWRNLRGLRFPPAMSLEERVEVERLLAKACLQAGGLEGSYLPLRGSASFPPRPGGMSETEARACAEAGLLFEAPDAMLRLCTGAGRHWPQGRGVFTSSDRSLLVWVNEQEHLRVAASAGDLAGALRALYGALASIEAGLAASLGPQPFERSDRLGFLTSSPAMLGAALQLTVTARLPRLQGSAADWKGWCARHRITARLVQEAGEGRLELSNSDRLGLSEIQLACLVLDVLSALCQMEQRLEVGGSIEDLLARHIEVSAGTPEAVQARVLTQVLAQGAARSSAAAALLAGPELGGDNAEEVMSAGPSRPPSPAAPRPASTQSVYTLRASSAAEVEHGPQVAQALVEGLIDAGIAHHVGEAAEPRPPRTLEELRVAAKSELLASLNSGALSDAVLALKQAREATEPASDDVQALALGTLMDGLLSGELDKTLEDVQRATSAKAAAAEVRGRVFEAFAASAQDGRLRQALVELANSRAQEAAADALRLQLRGVLQESLTGGALARAAAAVAAEAPAAVALQRRVGAALTEGLAAGTLGPAIAESSHEAIEDLRVELSKALAESFADGRLQQALGELKAGREAQPPGLEGLEGLDGLDGLRRRAAAGLVGGLREGRLESAVGELKRARQVAEGESARRLCAELLLGAAEDGRLMAAVDDLSERRKAEAGGAPEEPPAAAAGARPSSAAAGGDAAAGQPPGRPAAVAAVQDEAGLLEAALVPPEVQIGVRPAQAAYPLAVMPQTAVSTMDAAASSGAASSSTVMRVFEAVSARDRRLGELVARIRQAEGLIQEQDEREHQLLGLLAAAKQDLAHVELDIEWHQQALEAAERRSGELQQGQRQLLQDFEAQAQKVKPIEDELGYRSSVYSARSEVSTAAGSSMLGLSLTPRPATGRLLEPLPGRGPGTLALPGR